ncbi:MAG: hypothetical protein AB8B63_05995 [Granulosicoccus sp.]
MTLALHYAPENAIRFEDSIISRFENPATSYVIEFWHTDQCLVVPLSMANRSSHSEACQQMQASGWPVVVRRTGGGVTPQGPGIVNVAVAYAPDPVESPTVQGVYEFFCTPPVRALKQVGLDAGTSSVRGSFCDGKYNVVVAERKVMGTAQRWTRIRSTHVRRVVFAHALILLDADISAAADAINRFYRISGVDCSIRDVVHENVFSLAREQGFCVDQNQFVNALSKLYASELDALTG